VRKPDRDRALGDDDPVEGVTLIQNLLREAR